MQFAPAVARGRFPHIDFLQMRIRNQTEALLTSAAHALSPHGCPCPLMALDGIYGLGGGFFPLGGGPTWGAFISLLEAPRLQGTGACARHRGPAPGIPPSLEGGGGPNGLTTRFHKTETSIYLKSLRFARSARPRVTPRVTEPAQHSVWAIEACRCRSNAAAVSRPPEHYRKCSGRAAFVWAIEAMQRTGGLALTLSHPVRGRDDTAGYL